MKAGNGMIMKYKEFSPRTADAAFIAENASVIGRVTLAKNVSVWFGAVLRGDEGEITVGEGTNIQDNVTLHGNGDCPVRLGKNVMVGHNAVVHGCEIGDETLVGMGAVILNGAKVGAHCVIGAGALVKENDVIPEHSLAVGVPAKVVRTLPESDLLLKNAMDYIALAGEYAGAGRAN